MSDVYRDFIMRGGIPDLAFPQQLATSFVGENLREDLVCDLEKHPLFDECWVSRTPAFESIVVPAYIVASYSNIIHTPGTFRGWRNIASKDKWLRVHNNMEWPDYYEEANLKDLLRFFDWYLKGNDNGWEDTPRVRYSVLDLEGNDRINVPASAFPPDEFVSAKYYLNAATLRLQADRPTEQLSTIYDAESNLGRATFSMPFDFATEIVGYPKACLWVEARGSDDMDLFVWLQKLNRDGELLEQFTIPNHGPVVQELTREGSAILKYKGSNGRLRVSMRHLDEVTSSADNPVHTFDRVEKLAAGQVALVEIDIFPVGLALRPGEQIRLVISGQHLLGGAMPGMANVRSESRGNHIIHTGGEHASYLQLHTNSMSMG